MGMGANNQTMGGLGENKGQSFRLIMEIMDENKGLTDYYIHGMKTSFFNWLPSIKNKKYYFKVVKC